MYVARNMSDFHKYMRLVALLRSTPNGICFCLLADLVRDAKASNSRTMRRLPLSGGLTSPRPAAGPKGLFAT